jgi:hypothetical protein
VPEDEFRLARLPPPALSREELARFKQLMPSPQQLSLRQLGPSLKHPATLPSSVEFTRQGVTEYRRAITALERDLAARRRGIAAIELEIAAIEQEIAGRRETVRTLEEWLAREGRPPDPPWATSPSAKTPAPAPAASVAPDPLPTPEPEQVSKPAPGEEEEQDGPQAELTLLFFRDVYGGRPPEKFGYRRLHERMEDWVAKKNKDDGGSRVAASETTIRRVRKEL